MSIKRWAARRDENEPELVGIARELGAQMEQAGPMDWWAGFRGRWFPVEVKTQRGEYTDAQLLFIGRCKQYGNPVHTWRTPADVFQSLNATQTA